MPQRPREHVLEEENERTFRGVLPAEWVVRRIDPDYGIDLSVEIFQDGRSTALSFGVQLKATDQEDVRRALRSVRFSRDLAEYYWQQPIPVLIVRYHAPTGHLYARWWHAYNPLVAARPDEDDPASEPSKTVGFVFKEKDRWHDKSPDDLVEGVLSFRRFRSPDLPLPVTFNVSGRADAAEWDVARQLLGLRGLLEPVSGIVAVRSGPPGPDVPSIVIGREAITIALADVASITLDLPEEPPTVEQVAANLGCGIAMVLTTVGQANLAAQVAAACASRSTLITGMHVAWTLAGAFFRSQRIPEVLDVIEGLSEHPDEDARMAAFVLHSAVLARGDSMATGEQHRAADVARSAFKRSLAGGDRHAAAGDAYNLGNALARLGDWAGAVEMLGRAVELDPNYGKQAYFLRDLAISKFEAGAYEEAVHVASEALRVKPERRTRVLVADALMHAGRYREAQERFAAYLEESPDDPADGVWRLKYRVLGEVRSLAGDFQDRRPGEAEAIAQRVDFSDETITVEEAWTYIEHALRADALCGTAHHRKSVLSIKADGQGGVDLSEALEPTICAAVLAPWDPGWWTNAIRTASHHGEPDGVVYDVMRQAIYKTGQEVITEVLAAETPSLAAEHLLLLDKAAHDVAEERATAGFRLRLRDRDGSVQELVFEPETPDDPGADARSRQPDRRH